MEQTSVTYKGFPIPIILNQTHVYFLQCGSMRFPKSLVSNPFQIRTLIEDISVS